MICFAHIKNCYLHKVDSLQSKRFSISFSKISVQILVLTLQKFVYNSHDKFT